MSIFKKPPPPVSYATKAEVQEMIDDAIRNIIAMLQLSQCVLVGLFLHFLLRVSFDLLE